MATEPLRQEFVSAAPARIAILVVEDDDSVRSLATAILSGEGYDVRACPDLDTARAALSERVPDVVTLDLQLPDGLGSDFLAQLQQDERTVSVPVVVVTGTVSPDYIATVLAAGAHDFIHKPFEPVELAARVAAAVRAKRLRDDLTRLALHDALTGLLNRRGLLHCLDLWMANQCRTGEMLAVAMFDVVDFKAVNDTFGHGTGDRVLQEIGAVMQTALRGGDVLGRWGGDEFLAVLPRADEFTVPSLLTRLKEQVSSGVRVPGRLIEVRAGFAVADSLRTAPSDLLEAASCSLLREHR